MSTNKTKAILTVGVSASGKSTWASQFAEDNNGYILCRDDIRKEILSFQHGRPISDSELWKLWNWKKESEVTSWYNERLKCAIQSNEYDYIILADTNLNPKFRNSLINTIENFYEVPIEVKEFPITLEEAIKRDSNRKASVGESVIAKQFDQWIQYLEDKNGMGD